MINWLHTNTPSALAISWQGWEIYWYGFFLLFSFLAGLAITLFLAKKFDISRSQVWELAFWLMIWGIVGARIYEVLLVDFPYYWAHPFQIFQIWNGGLAIHGAILAGILVLYLWTKSRNISFWQTADLLVIPLALGQAIGRWGNYFNQELYGRPTDAPWGIPIELMNRLSGYEQFTYFHPTFLYESVGNFLIFIVLLIGLKYKKINGQLFFLYLGLYSLLRFVLEFIRLDPTLLIFGWRWPLLFSGGLIIISVFGFIGVCRRSVVEK